jgi:hypothetical protein
MKQAAYAGRVALQIVMFLQQKLHPRLLCCRHNNSPSAGSNTMRAKFNPQKIIDALFADDWLSPWQLR